MKIQMKMNAVVREDKDIARMPGTKVLAQAHQAVTVFAVAWPNAPMDRRMLEALGHERVFANVRLERVDEIRRKIANGTYQVSAQALADKLMGCVLSEVR